tara:strand:- start:200 stop:409 length:210 start_codon:yes stop_codon:yes gene_type:complete
MNSAKKQNNLTEKEIATLKEQGKYIIVPPQPLPKSVAKKVMFSTKGISGRGHQSSKLAVGGVKGTPDEL